MAAGTAFAAAAPAPCVRTLLLPGFVELQYPQGCLCRLNFGFLCSFSWVWNDHKTKKHASAVDPVSDGPT